MAYSEPVEVSSLASVEEIVRDIASFFDFLTPQLVMKDGANALTTLNSANDFHKLKEDFSKICCDYNECFEEGKKSKALEFFAKIIYHVGPESRKYRMQKGKHVWKFHFPNENQLETKTAFVTNTEKEGIYYEPLNNFDTIVLTLKQAGLLAVDKFCQLTDFSLTQSPPKYLFTPLAGSVFTKHDIDDIAEELKITRQQVLKAVNCSCQDGGEYLEASEMCIAAVASIPGLKKLKNDKARGVILRRLLKRYIAMKKEWNFEKFKIYASNAFWFKVPDPETLIAMFEEARRKRSVYSSFSDIWFSLR